MYSNSYRIYQPRNFALDKVFSSANYALTTAGAVGCYVPQVAKSTLTVIRAGRLALAPNTVENPNREFLSLGVSVICGILSMSTNNRTAAARAELVGNLAIDVYLAQK